METQKALLLLNFKTRKPKFYNQIQLPLLDLFYIDRYNMIQNERQYRITNSRLKEFQSAVLRLKSLPKPTDINGQLDYQADLDSLESFIEEFQEDIAEYENLKNGNVTSLSFDSFAKLPEALIKARIVRGLTQEQLAEKLNVKPQQVQRDESNGYASASFSKILGIQKALNIEVKEEIIFK
jgi:hypothetical protein